MPALPIVPPDGRPSGAAAQAPGETRVPPVVGIGASAGGLIGLTALLGGLPPDTGLAFVVVQHLDPHHDSLLVALLAKATAMRVVQIEDAMALSANTLHVIPPGAGLILDGDVLRLLPRDQGRPPMPIDAFLRSLADERRSDAIAVILSGAGTDGALGVQAVHEQGGFTFVQAPGDATFDGMPQSAIATGCVDVVLPATELGDAIARVARERSSVRPVLAAAQSAAEDEAAINAVMGLLLQATGVDFGNYRRTTIRRRLNRRIMLRGDRGFGEYLQYLEAHPSELQGLARDFLISVTRFFRDPEVFAFLEQVVFPELIRRAAPDRNVRIWVPGCSTGEEAYSLAISFGETAAAMQCLTTCQILATDINEAVLHRARQATYLENIAADVPAERLQRHFTRVSGGFRLSPAIRHSCAFSRHDVLSDPPMSRMDLVSCRNLLIYLGATQRRALAALHFSLEPGGYLVLGRSEAVSSAPEFFETVDRNTPVFRAIVSVTGRSTRAGLLEARRRMPFPVTPAEVPDATAYEELVAANEELQSLNEELENSKEEIQSINEELRTVNDEIRSRNDALHVAHAFAQATLDTVRSALVVLAPGDIVVNANRSFYRMLQLTPSDVVGRPLSDVAPDDLGAPGILALLSEVRSLSRVREDVEVVLQAEGRPGRVLVVNARRVVPGDQLLLSAEDVTTLRRIETERRQSQKMEAIGQLAAGVAHDFNNLLTVIVAGSHLAAEAVPGDSPARPVLDDVILAGRRAAELTRQLLAYAGKARVVFERVALSDLVVQTAHLLHATIPALVQLRLDLDQDLPPLLADPSQIHQVVANLVTNAVEAATAGAGTVLIRTGRQQVGHEAVASIHPGGHLPPGEYVFLEVQDTGLGMDASTQRQMFDPFFTTKFTGRGLGLAAVQGIVLQHQGTIEVRSVLGRGTSIKVLLSTGQARSLQDEPRQAVAPSRGASTVIVVDDEPLVVNLTRAALSAAGYTVLTAPSGPAALELLAEHREIALAILDETMPGVGGERTLKAIRDLGLDLPVIICSGVGDEAVERTFDGLGVAGYLHKPFSLQRLLAEVERAIGGTRR